ncbi:MAG: peptidylprolyl isomerase [Planctomycetia bacterium]
MKIENDCLVDLEYELHGANGDLLESSDSESLMSYLHGHGEIPPKLEAALAGHKVGDQINITLEPEDAYGEFNPDGIVAVPRDSFPEDAEIVPGDWVTVELQDDDGQQSGSMKMRVVEIAPDAITLDANHPHAGIKVTFDLSVKEIRKLSPTEVQQRSRESDED